MLSKLFAKEIFEEFKSEESFDEALAGLIEKKYVELIKIDGVDCVQLTELGKQWIKQTYN